MPKADQYGDQTQGKIKILSGCDKMKSSGAQARRMKLEKEMFFGMAFIFQQNFILKNSSGSRRGLEDPRSQLKNRMILY